MQEAEKEDVQRGRGLVSDGGSEPKRQKTVSAGKKPGRRTPNVFFPEGEK